MASGAARRKAAAAAAWLALVAIGLAIRLPFVLRVGPSEGSGDEWYAAWRSWAVLFERGNPGNFLHPALFYEAGAAVFSGLYVVGRIAGTFHSTVDLLADFVLHEARYLQALQVLAAVFGALTIPVVFELGRRTSGWCAALIAAGLIALLPLHVEYSQRIRVDALCVLLTALAALALHALAERGRRRDFILSGALIGLSTASNYPAAFLGVAYVAAALLARERSPGFAASFALGVVAAGAAFVLTNPYVVLAPRAAWEGFAFQLSLAVREHPYNEDVSRWFYLHVLRDQSLPFAILAGAAGAWLVVRGPGFRRVLGGFPWLFIGTFIAASNQVDRYILIATPWLCAAIGVFLVDVPSALRLAPLRAAAGAASVAVLALATFGLWERATPRVLGGAAADDPHAALQRWLIERAPADGTVWLESDVLPLVQATFADPGGDLQALVQRAFVRAHPGFRARVLKGERVARSANFDPRLVTGKQIDLVVTCDGYVRYADGAGPGHDAERAFYAAVAEHGTRRFAAGGCWIAQIR